MKTEESNIVINWTKPEFTEFTKYRLEVTARGRSPKIWEIPGRESMFIANNLISGSRHYITLIPYMDNRSLDLLRLEITAETLPISPPKNFRICSPKAVESDRLTLCWDKSDKDKNYDIGWKPKLKQIGLSSSHMYRVDFFIFSAFLVCILKC